MIHVGFIIEQALGHITHGQNLLSNVQDNSEIAAHWGLPRWDANGLTGKIPNWTLRAGLQARRMVGEMERSGPLDVLFFHTQVTAVLSQSWLRRIPSVVSLDATPLQYDALGEFYAHAAGPRWLEQWKWRLNHNVFHAARHVVSWSEWAKAGLSAYAVPADKVTVIPPGVNVADWTPPAARRHDAETVKILFVGGDLERKGGKLLLKAFRTLRATATTTAAPALELHLVTRTAVPPEPGLFVYNNMQPNSPRLKQLFFDSDIFCLPTYGDCLPLALAEAGAAGLPLVAADVAAIPEIVQEGVTGFLAPRGDVDALAETLQRLIDQPELRRRLGDQAAQLVAAEHDAGRNARRLLALLKDVAGCG